MTEKIKITGEVMAFSNPFSYQPPISMAPSRPPLSLSDIIMVRTDLGLICVPIRDPQEYQIHQKLEISVTIKSKEEGIKNA